MRYHGASYAEDAWDVYWYEKNLQGDIVAVYNDAGTKLISYEYDAYGRSRSLQYNGGYSTTAVKNPFRYRGYYYDEDIGLYYLNSRYYDAYTGRFISADVSGVITATPNGLTDKNLYAYCDNNPVMRRDDGGQFWDTFFDVVSLTISIIDVINNPQSASAWAGLTADVVCLITPGLTGGGTAVKAITKTDDVVDIVKATEKADTVIDGVKIQKATDFTSDAKKIINSLDHTEGVTKSSAVAGTKIHNGYKADYINVKGMEKEYSYSGNRIDFLDKNNKIIYELKPNNPKSINRGIKQLKRYNNAMGGGYTLILEVY